MADVEMATQTEVTVENREYQRQRSNSDPQPAIEALNALNVQNEPAKSQTLKKHHCMKLKDKRKNGEMKSSSLGPKTPPPERKSKFAALGKIFKPWKWKKKKKSENIVRKAVDLERKISMRSTREELIRKGVLKEADDIQENHVNKLVSAAQVRPVVISMFPRTKEPSDHPDSNSTDGGMGDSFRPQNIQIELDNYDQTAPHNQPYIDDHSMLRCRKDGDGIDEISYRRCLKDEDSDENSAESPELYDNGTAYEAVPASEPNLSLLPKKSALKRTIGVGADALPSPNTRCHQIPSVGATAAIHNLAQKVDFSDRPVQIIPPVVHSPSNTIHRPRLRVTVSDNDSDKENLPGTDGYYPDYDNLPGEDDSDDHDDDSSSDDGEIHYMEKNSLGAKVARHDSLARFLNNRPSRRELVEKNIIPTKSEKEKQEDREAIGTKLTRRLSLRPTPEELEQRNILHNKTAEEAKKEKEEKKRYLVRKLSFRPSIDELKERKIIKFNDYVEVTEAQDYDRRADKPWTRLTPKDKAAIRKELNEYKSKEMEVHEDSRHLTRFHRP